MNWVIQQTIHGSTQTVLQWETELNIEPQIGWELEVNGVKAKIVRVIYSVTRMGKAVLEYDHKHDSDIYDLEALGWLRVDQEELLLDDLYVEPREEKV